MRRAMTISALILAAVLGEERPAEARSRCRRGGCETHATGDRGGHRHGAPVRRALGWLLLRGGRRC